MGRFFEQRDPGEIQRDDWGNPIHRRVWLDRLENGEGVTLDAGSQEEETDEVSHPEDDGDLL